MSSAFENSFYMRRPPHGQGTTDHGANLNFATAGAGSTAALDILGDDFIYSYAVFRFDQDCFVRFGPAAVAAATALDFPVRAGEVWEWLLCGPVDRYLRIIRGGAIDVAVDVYLSDRNTGFPTVGGPPTFSTPAPP
jgi:hypothetical protein